MLIGDRILYVRDDARISCCKTGRIVVCGLLRGDSATPKLLLPCISEPWLLETPRC
jgi:hypothetical protein